MRFENSFDVEAPIDEVYETLLDLDKVAPAMPGAQVTDHVGDDAYKVAIKVKLGPMTMNYRGDVEVQEKDPDAHRAKMHVKAREARGQGNATADVVMSLNEQGGGTHATIDAEVQLAGKAASMGRGLIEDVSAKLVNQFADNLQQMFVANGGPEEAESGERKAESGHAPPPPQAEAFDAGNVAAQVASDRLRDPRAIGVLLVVALLIWLIGRR
jgi:carbon monoxide dehydrogenase subunit G